MLEAMIFKDVGSFHNGFSYLSLGKVVCKLIKIIVFAASCIIL